MLPRMRTLKILCAVLTAVALCRPSSAEDGRRNDGRRNRGGAAQAELQINVVVVPIVAPPRHHRRRDRDEGPVSYNLFPLEEKLSITEEVRTMQVNARQEQVRITTVVTK